MNERETTVLKRVNKEYPHFSDIKDVTGENAEWEEFLGALPFLFRSVMPSASLGVARFSAAEESYGYALVKDYVYGSVHLFKLGG